MLGIVKIPFMRGRRLNVHDYDDRTAEVTNSGESREPFAGSRFLETNQGGIEPVDAGQDNPSLVGAALGVGEPHQDFEDLPDADEIDDLSANVSRETPTLPQPDLPRIMVVANQKGGVGKTTTAVNVAAGLAQGGLRVLVVDADPQGNASTALGVDHSEGVMGTYEVLVDAVPLIEVVQKCPDISGLWVSPATIDLTGAEIGLVASVSRETKLKQALDSFFDRYHVDYVIIDCPPSLGLLTLNALVAAREILIPIQAEYYALEGVTALLRTIDLVKGRLNDHLKLSTVLLTMYDARTNLAAQVAAEVRKHFPAQTLDAVIPRSVRVAEAPSHGQTVLTYHLNSAGAQAYVAAAEEIAHRAEPAL